MKKKHYSYFILTFLIVSCNFHKNEVFIENNSEMIVDSIYVIGNPLCKPLIFYNIAPKDKINKKLINCDKEGNDGSYLFKIYYNDTIINKSYGYFSNGVPIFNKLIMNFDKKNNIIIVEN